MVIPFDRHFKRRQDQEQYRRDLVDRILAHYRQDPKENAEGSMYIEHVKQGFPVEILENIVQKLEQRAGGT
ncbi:MAG: hypothetical protein H7249_15350 [Chitinophagaceae bacterium]|nr:hypothetical protein [Oligoflexus sp.]